MAAQEDLDALVNFLLPFAQQMLGEHDEFFPFGASMSSGGEVGAVALELDEEQAASEDVVEALREVLRVHAADGDSRACGICSDTTLAGREVGKTDAVRVSLEHRDAEPVDVYLPYTVSEDEYLFGDPLAMRGERTIFA